MTCLRLSFGCALLLAAGCATTTRVDELETRIRALESGHEQEREELQTQVANAKQQLVELERLMESATTVVKRNNADIALEVRELKAEMQAIQGEMAEVRNSSEQSNRELEQRMQQFARKAGVDVPIDPAIIPADREAHYKAAMRAHQNSDHTIARGLLREYLKRYPSDENAAAAQYYLGASYLKQGQPATALGEYRIVITEHAQSDVVIQTLYDMGVAFWELHSCDDARAALNALIKRDPKSNYATQAKNKLRAWKTPAPNYCQ